MESDIKRRLLLWIPHRWRARLFNNPVGEAWVGKESNLAHIGHVVLAHRRIKYGLATGSSDLIGIASVTVTPEMVGRTLGVFTAIETKYGRRRATQEQSSFITMVRDMGGIAGVARTSADVEKLLSEVQQVPPP